MIHPPLLKPTKARTYWLEANWPWQVATALIALDIAGLAVARFGVGIGVNGGVVGDSLRTGPLMAIGGNWSIVTRLLLVLVFVAFYTARGVPPRAFGFAASGFRRRFQEFGRCLAVIVPLAAGALVLLVLLLRGTGQKHLIGPPVPLAGPGDTASWILIFVVALPLLEEPLYRGIVHPTLRRRWGAEASILAGGALFGLVHAFYGIDAASLTAYAFGGAALAFVYERTGSLFFPWLLHVATNLAGVWISSFPKLYEALRT